MRDFVITQYKIHQTGGKSIGIKRIRELASVFLTEADLNELFGGEEK